MIMRSGCLGNTLVQLFGDGVGVELLQFVHAACCPHRPYSGAWLHGKIPNKVD